MSKRPASPSVAPLKVLKVDDVWTLVPSEPTDVPTLNEEPAVSRPLFNPVPSGSKARIQQSYVLSFKPLMQATINLFGNLPEVRFSSQDSSICITGDEFLELANCRHLWPTAPVFLTNTRLEPLADGSFRFVRYTNSLSQEPSPAQLMDIFPTDVFDMSKYAVQRLKAKLDIMSRHVFKILESEPVINQMFDSIVVFYRQEYHRRFSPPPIESHVDDLSHLVETHVLPSLMIKHFDELSHLVEAHVPPSEMIKHFRYHTAGSPWNHYSLLGSTLIQKKFILSML